MYAKFLKRVLDLILSLFFLVLFSPILILLLLIVSVSNGGPVFFTQLRPGYKGRPFRLVKLKTMKDTKDEAGILLPDSMRVTPIGRIIRSLSLDELPQILNILAGDMSFVGPRPLLTDYMPFYNNRQKRRHDVRPGITGWAQVNGRNKISWEEKFELDIWYIENVSFLLDLKIILITIWKIIKREGINSSDYITMKKFTG